MMTRIVILLIVVALLGGLFAMASNASYNGVGLISSGDPNARSGSLLGPIIYGGGPGSGK